MRESMRCQVVTINKKIKVDVRLSLDGKVNPLYESFAPDNSTHVLNLYPTVSIQILKPTEIDDTGRVVRPPWNANDILGLTKYNYPIFVNELKGIQEDMKIPNLYTYLDKRLELNEEVAAKIRRVFKIGSTMTIEFSAVIITQPNVDGIDERMEGIKIKFNNEQSATTLTLNELDSLVFNLDHLNADVLATMMFLAFVYKPGSPREFDVNNFNKVEVDIEPLKKSFASDDDNID